MITRVHWSLVALPDPWAVGLERMGCSWPTLQRWREDVLPARKCSRCPSGCLTACTERRSGTWGMAPPAGAERWSQIDMVAHCTGRSHWAGTGLDWSESWTCVLAGRLWTKGDHTRDVKKKPNNKPWTMLKTDVKAWLTVFTVNNNLVIILKVFFSKYSEIFFLLKALYTLHTVVK